MIGSIKKGVYPKVEPGFTLLELLLGVAILAVVVTAVYGAYRSTFTIVEGGRYQAFIAEAGGFVLGRLSDDLASIVLGEDGFLVGKELERANHRGDSLAFLAHAHIALGKNETGSGRYLIRYSAVLVEGAGLFKIYREEIPVRPGIRIGDGEAAKVLVASGVQAMMFSYHPAEGDIVSNWQSGDSGLEKAWKEDTALRLPRMITVDLQFPEGAGGDKGQTFKLAVALPTIFDEKSATHRPGVAQHPGT